MSLSVLLMLLLLAVLLVASAFFSGSETALFSLTRHQRARFERSSAVSARIIVRLLSETRGLLITLLLGNMTINVLYFVISSVLLIRASDSPAVPPWAVVLLTLAPLLVIILMGEVLPKLVASTLPVQAATLVALPLLLVHRILTPIRVFSATLIIAPLSRLIAPPAPSPDLSPDELETMLQLSRHHGVIDQAEQRVLEQVLELSQLSVRHLMVPRVGMQAFDLNRPLDELYALIRQTRLRHIPACRGDLDKIEGLLYSRQVLLAQPRDAADLARLVRQVNFIPELQRADRTLIELRKSGTTFAIAVDEYGGTAGLITLEDLVEHLVGDLPGAYESSGEVGVQAIGPGRFRVDADLSVHDWPDVFGRHQRFEAARSLAAVNTVGGLVMAELGRVPAVGDSITLGNLRISVEAMEAHRVQSLIIALLDHAEPAPRQRAAATLRRPRKTDTAAAQSAEPKPTSRGSSSEKS